MSSINPMSPMSPIIKVCGMRQAENIRAVEEQARPDLMGFIFWEHSPRYVGQVPAYLPGCRRVGVFVGEDIDVVLRKADEFALDFIQLHGNESPEYVRRLQGRKVIKAFSIASAADLEQTRDYEGLAHCFLFDTKGRSAGGNGKKFDWSILSAYHGRTPFLLSGGIGPDDAEQLSRWHHDKCLGFDINSRFELQPGIKDAAAVARFAEKIRKQP